MTDFLLEPGTNGFIATPFNLLSTELNSLANNNSVVSSVGGSSGVFSQSNTANAIFGSVWLVSGGSFDPSGDRVLRGWFLRSVDGGTTFERAVSNTEQPRAPDFIIPLFDSAYSSGNIAYASPEVRLPWEPFKVMLFNASGVTLPSSGNLVKLGAAAIKF